jgi:ATP-dependent RNA helicase HelY
MPARSVVLEKLVKWNGETHADVTPGEYTQLTGRAGRRGIDVEGHAVVLWQPGMDPRTVAGLASTRTYPLRSSFRPSYNMAVNLVGSLGREAARTLLESSFAQFQADASVVGLARQVARNLEGLEGYREAMTCHLGDAQEYGRLRAELKARESELARTGASLRRAARRVAGAAEAGDVIRVPTGRRSGLAVVLDPGVGSNGESHPMVTTEDRWSGPAVVRRLPGRGRAACPGPIPKGFNARSPAVPPGHGVHPARPGPAVRRPPWRPAPLRRRRRRAAGRACAPSCGGTRCTAATTGRTTCAGPSAGTGCAARPTRSSGGSRARPAPSRARSTGCAASSSRSATSTGESVAPAGQSLARVYSESDLLAVESVRRGLWDDLSPAELAAVVSTLVYSARRADESNPLVPSGAAQGRCRRWVGCGSSSGRPSPRPACSSCATGLRLRLGDLALGRRSDPRAGARRRSRPDGR